MMPSLTVYALRAALTWLVVGFTVGALMLVDKGVGTLSLSADWLHIHMHMLLFGFVVQTVFAVAYWMLPRFGRDRPRTPLAVAAILLVNAAILAALLLPWLPVLHPAITISETLAVALFVIHAVPRVKAFG